MSVSFYRFTRRGDTAWHYYEVPRWWDAKTAARLHFPAVEDGDLIWENVSKEAFDAALAGGSPCFRVYWTGHDAGPRPTKKMHVTEVVTMIRRAGIIR